MWSDRPTHLANFMAVVNVRQRERGLVGRGQVGMGADGAPSSEAGHRVRVAPEVQ